MSKLPLVYSCSGCSNLAQLANQLALHLNREKRAEMSCIAGVGGDVKSLVKTAQSCRPILAIDGCPLACVENCLKRQGVTATKYIVLSDFGYKKKYNQDYSEQDFKETYQLMSALIDDIK